LSPYHSHEEITNEQIKEWYSKASLNKFNVFDDYNKIILQLCRKLLEGADDGE
tara:strand:+ start:388 stop:546 length:159 start_codon:yes stop_codon:yes gene_type:complete